MTTRVKINEQAIRAKVLDNLMRRAERTAGKIAGQLRKNLSTPGPEPSRPGEYPHRQTGELASSVSVVKRNQYRVDVVVNAPHAPYVEATRPFLARTVDEMHASIVRELERE